MILSDSSARAVSMMIGTAATAGSARMASHTTSPLSPGSIRSRITISGGSARTRARPSEPDAARSVAWPAFSR